MNPIRDLLSRVRAHLLRDRALTWGANGLAVAALAALAFEVSQRLRPLDPAWPALAACAVLGLLVAARGRAPAWPAWPQGARLDRPPPPRQGRSRVRIRPGGRRWSRSCSRRPLRRARRPTRSRRSPR